MTNISVRNRDIQTNVFDYGIPKRSKPVVATVNYEDLRSGSIELNGRRVPTAPLSSLKKARDIALSLKSWIQKGEFLLQQPVQPLPLEARPKTLEEVEVK